MFKRLLDWFFGRRPAVAAESAPAAAAVATVEPDPQGYRALLDAFDAPLFGEDVERQPEALGEPERHVLDHVDARLRAELPADDLPKLPATVSQLMQELHHEDASSTRIEELVHRDPSLAGDVLRLANSAAFRSSPTPVSSIERALLLVGHDTLRSMAVALLMKPMLRIRPEYFERFGNRLWVHSMATAVACRALAREHDCDPFVAYFTGLANNIGRIAIFRLVAETYAHTVPRQPPQAAVFCVLMRRYANIIAATIVRQWGVEMSVPLAIHDQERIVRGEAPQVLTPFGRLLFRGNLLASAALLHAEGAREPACIEAALAAHGLSLALAKRLDLDRMVG